MLDVKDKKNKKDFKRSCTNFSKYERNNKENFTYLWGVLMRAMFYKFTYVIVKDFYHEKVTTTTASKYAFS